MDLVPQLPPLPTLTLMTNVQNVPPDNPPDPPSSSLFPSQPLANPIEGQPAKGPEEVQFAPLPEDMSAESLETAVKAVIAIIERGYHSTRDETPLNAGTWAKLSCIVLAAIGRGYDCQYTAEKDAAFKQARAESFDPEPLTPECPTYFHRLATTAGSISLLVQPPSAMSDINHNTACVVSRPCTAPGPFASPATSLAVVLAPSSSPISRGSTPRGRAPILTRSRTAAAQSQDKPSPVRDMSISSRDRSNPRKRSASPKRSRADSPKRPRAPSRAASGLLKRRMALLTTSAGTQSTPILVLSPKAASSLSVKTIIPPPPADPAPPGFDTIMAAVQTALGAAVTAAMAPYAAKLEALEKASKPPQAARRHVPTTAPTTAPVARPEGQGTQTAKPPNPPKATVHMDSGFILIDRQSKKWKGKAKANNNGQTADPPVQAAPASYANATTKASNIHQPQPTRKQNKALSTITEVTVIRTGGHFDPDTENQIRTRAADAIVREVRIKMAKTVARPIPLRAGRWSIHPRSKGNFVFSFEGSVPFDLIQSYECLLLEPFYGSGHLCPSMGWSRFLVHSVPIWDEENCEVFTPESLLNEVRSLPGLKKAVFAMQPRWLKPVDSVESYYSTITFALSDPDGRTTNNLLNGRSALFGKEVTVRKWIDKPALIQCSRCHALGHNKSSKACQLGKDSVKCFRCGGAHRSETHDKQCPRNHVLVGVCDCQHYKCLNCHNRGHNCRDVRCPARDLYRPRSGKGKVRPTEPTAEPNHPAEAGPSRQPPSNLDDSIFDSTDNERIEEYEKKENEMMEWEGNTHPDHRADQAAAHISPAASNDSLVYADPPAERNANEQTTQPVAYSPSQPAVYNNPPNLD